MKKAVLAGLMLLSPLAVAGTTVQASSDSAQMTVVMSDNSSAPVRFHIMGNGPAVGGVPGVCEVEGEARYWAGTESGLAWMYLSPDHKTMVLLKARSDGRWTVMGLIPPGQCGEGAESSLDGVYTRTKK